MSKLTAILCALALCALTVGGCSTDEVANPVDNTNIADQPQSVDQEIDELQTAARPVAPSQAPSDLATITFGGKQITFWPYTGNNFSGEPVDPINVVFYGQVDPRDIRAALLTLSGDRTAFGFPDVAPFNLKWTDCIGGDVQTAYSTPAGWIGSVIQLTCGEYGPTRIHIRLFKMGQWTVCGAHFEVQIPGTTSHQVLSWEIAEQVVVADLVRSGLLDASVPMYPSGTINASPYRTIPAMIYNLLPPELQGLTGGPIGQVTEDVPIWTDGQAYILNVVKKVKRVPGTWTSQLVVNFDQAIPKPFCSSGEYDYVYVSGPVNFVQRTRLTAWGSYDTYFDAEGELTIVPINPATGEPIGSPLTGIVRQHDSSFMTDRLSWANSLLYQKLTPWSDPAAGRLFVFLSVNQPGRNLYISDERCASADYLASATTNWDDVQSVDFNAAKPTGFVIFK